MAPKKKSGGKGGGSGYIIDGVSTTEMTREQLEVFAHRLRDEVEREREERNYFQLERDKLRTFWEVCRQQLEESKAEIRNKDRKLQERDENHRNKISDYNQRVKFLLLEHQNNICELKTENMVSLKLAEEEYNANEILLLKDKKHLKEIIRKQRLNHVEEIRTLKLEQSEHETETRQHFEHLSRQLEEKYEKILEKLREDLNLQHRIEMSELAERKNKHIHDLLQVHERNVCSMRDYFNEITLNNLSLISRLKEQIEKLKFKESLLRKKVGELKEDNEKIRGPYEKSENVIAELQRKLSSCEKEKAIFEHTKARLATCEKELENLKWASEIMQTQFQKLEAERDDLHQRFSEAIVELQQRSGLKQMVLQGKMKTLTEQLEKKDAQLSEVLRTAADISTLTDLRKNLETSQDLLDRKNAAIHDLQFEVARMCKAHDDLLDAYESKLKKYGIPKEELGFTPMRTTTKMGKKVGRSPAGLVAENP